MKKIVLIGCFLFFAIGVGVWSFLRSQNHATPKENAVESQIADLKIDKLKLLEWKDQAGFSFQYYDGVKVNPHEDDSENYAHLELTHLSHPGSLIVWVKDTTATDVTSWVRTEKIFAETSPLDTQLGGQPAKKVFIASKNASYIGAVMDGLLFLVEVNAEDAPYWNSQFESITNSFVFTKPADSSTTARVNDQVSSHSEEEISVDEEEVVE